MSTAGASAAWQGAPPLGRRHRRSARGCSTLTPQACRRGVAAAGPVGFKFDRVGGWRGGCGSWLWLVRRSGCGGWAGRAGISSRPPVALPGPPGPARPGRPGWFRRRRRQSPVDHIGQSPTQATQGFQAGLSLGQLPLVGAAAGGVVPDLADRGDVEHVVEPPVAGAGQPMPDLGAGARRQSGRCRSRRRTGCGRRIGPHPPRRPDACPVTLDATDPSMTGPCSRARSLGDRGRRGEKRPDLEPLVDRLAAGAGSGGQLPGQLDRAIPGHHVDDVPAGDEGVRCVQRGGRRRVC